MSERFAQTVAEAVERDLLWRCDPVQYDRCGRRFGPPVWSVVRVIALRATSIETQTDKYVRLRPNQSMPYVRGSSEREQDWWLDRRYALAEAIRDCNDLDTLKGIVHLLDHVKPTSFTTIPAGTEIR